METLTNFTGCPAKAGHPFTKGKPMEMKPLFMWAGGKKKMIKKYLPLMPIAIDTYVEPFFGGGALFTYVMKNYQPREVVINDINGGITNIYNAIKTDVDYFCIVMDRLEKEYLPLSKEDRKIYYYKIRHEHAYDYTNWDKTKEAAYLYFLMKTGFNGVWQENANTNERYGTPAGLLNQKDSVYSVDNVMLWHRALQNVKILNGDWSDAMVEDKSNTFIFLDPPYRKCFAEYANPMTDETHEKMLTMVMNYKEASVWYCNQDSGDGWFDKYNPLKWEYTYTAGRRKRTENGFEAKKAVEILVRNK